MAEQDANMRFVVFHRPGPNWVKDADFREQPGVGEHAQHYAKLHGEGKLAMGGPFLAQDRGGMMVTIAGVTAEEIEAFAAADPAVKSGLLTYEVVPWYTPMKGTE